MLDIFLVQMGVSPNDKAKNFAKVEFLTQSIKKNAGDQVSGLIILPEMFATGYLPLHPESAAEDFSTRESGETAKFLGDLADRTGCAVLGAGISKKSQFSTCAGNEKFQLFNHSSLYLPSKNKEVAYYDKCHPFFMEQRKFTPGESINLFKINHWEMAATICFDLRFPELYRDAVKLGAKLITVQAAWPAARIPHWKTLLQARAIENQVYIAAVNCANPDTNSRNDSKELYGGCSMIVNPQGEVMEIADPQEEKVVHAQITSAPQQEYRQKFPVLNGIVPPEMI